MSIAYGICEDFLKLQETALGGNKDLFAADLHGKFIN